MRRKFFTTVFVYLFTVIALSSCKKDDSNDNTDESDSSIKNNTVTAVVENGNSYNDLVATVKLEIYDDAGGDKSELANAEYKDGGFTITLPSNLGSQYLVALDDYFSDNIVSNNNVKGLAPYLDVYIKLVAYNESGHKVGYLYYGTQDWKGDFSYMDNDVSVSGSSESMSWVSISGSSGSYSEQWTKTKNYSMNLKKGWNRVYTKTTETKSETNNIGLYEYSSTSPANAKWYYESDGN
jgi:hypothetical protein